MASHRASRVFSRAHTAARPEALVSRAYWATLASPPIPPTVSSKRIGSAVGSTAATLPKKLSSVVVESDVWVSVEPIRPNLKGLAPNSASYASPRLRASRAYSLGSMSFVFGAGPS